MIIALSLGNPDLIPPTIRIRDEPEEQPEPKPRKRRATLQGNTVGYAVRRIGNAAEEVA
jgi:hypothetical protein